jgi:hypothetical protein
MRKNALKPMPTEERLRQNWIQELRGLGVTSGPNAKPFEEMDFYDIRSYLVIQQMKHGTDIDIDSKANAMF